MNTKVEIDPGSGFCSGVRRAVRLAEEELKSSGKLYCLGEIVHNHPELDRLKALGLKIIDYDEFKKLRNVKVLIRAHGEPPEIFELAKANHIEIINATCPIVSKLQVKISADYQKCKLQGGRQIIFGKHDHPEVRALVGQTKETATVIRNLSEFDEKYLDTPVYLYSQTTMNEKEYEELVAGITDKVRRSGNNPENIIRTVNSICNHVSHREAGIVDFAKNHEIILFISSRESSNGKMLFDICKSINPASYFITDIHDVDTVPFDNSSSIGICGATSTPQWLLQKIRSVVNDRLENYVSK
jgi:4-hydroxy-3-methylbut-2-enyl diphosphate reductase